MIYYVRHGQTDFNLYKITQGQIDTSLNRTGLMQAQQLAEELKGYSFGRVFCSPLIRAQQTLEAILKYHPENVPIFDDRLKEIGKGVMEGGKNSMDVYADFYAHPEKYGGETSAEVYERVNSFLTEITQTETEDENTLIVAHHGIFKYFPFCLAHKDPERDEVQPYRMHNCEIVNLTKMVAAQQLAESESAEQEAQEEQTQSTENSSVSEEQPVKEPSEPSSESSNPEQEVGGSQTFEEVMKYIKEAEPQQEATNSTTPSQSVDVTLDPPGQK